MGDWRISRKVALAAVFAVSAWAPLAAQDQQGTLIFAVESLAVQSKATT